jgi:hypothetical protein
MLARILITASVLIYAPPTLGGQDLSAQSPGTWYAGALSGGRAFMIDTDDPDPAGSASLTGSIERRRAGRSLSFGVEAGYHRYLVMVQDLAPDVTGWAGKLEDKRQAWRLTPYLRWRTRGAVSLSAQLGAGVYLRRMSYLQQERQAGELVVNTSYTRTSAQPGINLGIGLDIFPPNSPVGLGLGLRTHAVRRGDGFHSAEVGIVWRAGPLQISP